MMPDKDVSKALPLLSDRLEMRLIEWQDLAEIHALLALPETDAYNALGVPKNPAETKEIIAPWIAEFELERIEKYTFALRKRENREFIGMFGLWLGREKYQNASVWYKILPVHWGNGYATEALEKAISFGFEELGLHRISAGCAVENLASARVMEKAKMIYEGKERKVLPLKTGWSDAFSYAILETDPR